MSTSKLFVDPAYIARAADDDAFSLAFARIENHFFSHAGWFKTDGQLITDATMLENAGIPGVVVQGRYDCVCPTRSAYELCKRWPSAKLEIIADAGHSCKEKGIIDGLVRATDSFRDLACPEWS